MNLINLQDKLNELNNSYRIIYDVLNGYIIYVGNFSDYTEEYTIFVNNIPFIIKMNKNYNFYDIDNQMRKIYKVIYNYLSSQNKVNKNKLS